MCFSPQRHTIFRHRNCKKCFEADVFCTFSLENVLFATAACNFWFLLWPHDSAPAALTGLLLDWPDTRIIEKTQHFVTSLTFSADVFSFTWLSHYCIFCRLTCLLYCCAFHRLFNSPYCRKFLFKLPSTIMYIYIHTYIDFFEFTIDIFDVWNSILFYMQYTWLRLPANFNRHLTGFSVLTVDNSEA